MICVLLRAALHGTVCGMPNTFRPRSTEVTEGLEKAAARGMLRATGMDDADLRKPQVGVASSWNEITPCNMNLDRLAQSVKEGVHQAGGYPMQFGTISVSDGVAMGHVGMHYSLVSREVIADSVETVMQAERMDACVLLAGCDKSLPGMLMAAARLDLASVLVYAGTALPGRVQLSDGSERELTIVDAFEAVGACARGLLSRDDVDAIERPSAPARAAAPACIPRTRWRAWPRPWACPCRAAPRRRQSTAAAPASRTAPAPPSSSSCAWASPRGRS